MSRNAREGSVRMLKTLVRGMVEELEAEGERVNPSEVAARAMMGLRQTIESLAERLALRRELEDYVRDIRSDDLRCA
jgi:hypothetical protein